MQPRERALAFLALILFGAGWGLSAPLLKVVIGEGYRGFGILFWQHPAGAAIIFALLRLRGLGLPLRPRALRIYAAIAAFGVFVPSSATVHAAPHLPAGVLSVIVSMTPVMAFAIALALGRDRPSVPRLAGLALGVGGIALMALPGSSLPDPAMLPFVLLAIVTPLSYAVESSVVGGYASAGLDPVQAVCGAYVLCVPVGLALALAEGTLAAPTAGVGFGAMLLAVFVNSLVYAGYVWLVGRTGAVFASQVAYLVTAFGLIWSMGLLGERYGAGLWVAFAVLFAGMALVQPRGPARSAKADL